MHWGAAACLDADQAAGGSFGPAARDGAMRPFAQPGKADGRDQQPLGNGGEPDSSDEQERHPWAVGPGLPDVDVQPFAKADVTDAKCHGRNRHPAEVLRRPGLPAKENDRGQQRDDRDEHVPTARRRYARA